MFDIAWSELMIIGVVALIAIGPKELPGVLRMIGQWLGKARKMASEFQGQFNDAMREAEMADLKKTFDDVKEAAQDLKNNNLLTSMSKDVTDALTIDKIETMDKPAADAQPGEVAVADTPVAEVASANFAEYASGGVPTPAVETADMPELLNTYVSPTTPELPTAETLAETEAQVAASEPLIITREFTPVAEQAEPTVTASANESKDAKAS